MDIEGTSIVDGSVADHADGGRQEPLVPGRYALGQHWGKHAADRSREGAGRMGHAAVRSDRPSRLECQGTPGTPRRDRDLRSGAVSEWHRILVKPHLRDR